MGLVRTVAPAVEPLTVTEARDHLLKDSASGEAVPSAPTVDLASPAAAGNVDNGAHRYAVTFVTADGETSAGDISDAVTVADKTVNGQVAVTNIPIGGARVTQRKLYRTTAGGSTYLLVATINNNTATTYTDNVADASLGAAVPSANTTLNPEISALIMAARDYVENFTRRALLEQTWRLTLDAFPAEDEIELPRPNLLSVESVTYIDTDGASQPLATTEYEADTATLPGRIRLKYEKSWPSTRAQANAVTITFKAGYGASAASVPEAIRAAIKLLIGDWFHNRRAAITGTIRSDNPAVERLLWPYRASVI